MFCVEAKLLGHYYNKKDHTIAALLGLTVTDHLFVVVPPSQTIIVLLLTEMSATS